jgi:Mce-associated membrane protein
MAVAPALDPAVVVSDENVADASEDVPRADPPGGPPVAAVFRLVLLGVLVVALVASVATAAVLWSHRRGHADALQSQREAVMAQTQQFVLRANTYDPAMLDAQGRMPTYRSRVESVITPKLAASFEQGAAGTEQTVKNYRVTRRCAVYATGVEVIDSDSAEVLVAGSLSETRAGAHGRQVPAGEPAPFRLRVSLDKIDGRWLVDSYSPVTGA